MGFSFAETMAGWLETADGQRHPFHFRVEAHAPSLRSHIRNGEAELRGVMHAPPFAQSADATGTILIRPIGRRLIRYRLTFQAEDGRALTFTGEKHLRWRALRQTFTELEGELRDEHGDEVAVCQLTFDLRRDWLTFARSFRRTP